VLTRQGGASRTGAALVSSLEYDRFRAAGISEVAREPQASAASNRARKCCNSVFGSTDLTQVSATVSHTRLGRTLPCRFAAVLADQT